LKITEDQYLLFVRKCKEYVKLFGLNTWDIKYMLVDDESENLAECWSNYTRRAATLVLYQQWPDHYEKMKSLDRMIDRAAFHEVMDLMLSPLVHQARAREWNDDEFRKELHVVIRRFEHVFIPPKEMEE